MTTRRNHHALAAARGSLPQPLCQGKRRYPTQQEAAIVKAEQEIINPGLTLKIYHCVTCGNWHLTRTQPDTHNIEGTS